MATHSSIPTWKIPWTEEPGRYSLWGHRELDMTEHMCFASLSYIYGWCPFNELTQLLVLTSCPVKWPSC